MLSKPKSTAERTRPSGDRANAPAEQTSEETAHTMVNLISIMIGYCDVLLAELAPDDPHCQDVQQIRIAGEKALALTRGGPPPPLA